MRKLSLSLVAVALACSTLALAHAQQPPSSAPAAAPQQQPPPPPPAVKVGEPAPDFTLAYFAPLGDGKFEPKKATLSDYKGKQNVVLAFFPAAFSPGCTRELQKYHETTGQFTAANTTILGISVDSTWSNKAFREQLGADFPILSDWKKEVSRKYGILDENSGFARRTTFVIDKNGVVQKIDQGSDALDPSGVVGMCQKLSKGTM
jgi:peroxiredoxin Q/BCP